MDSLRSGTAEVRADHETAGSFLDTPLPFTLPNGAAAIPFVSPLPRDSYSLIPP